LTSYFIELDNRMSERDDFVNFCNIRKHVLLDQYPNATAQEIVSLMVSEFNELTPLPPPYLAEKKPITISDMLFGKK
jgi:hypothetical protein